MNAPLESSLHIRLKPLIKNQPFLRGAILMAYACQSDGKPQRAEAFAVEIVLMIVNNILQVEATLDDLVQSKVACNAIDSVVSESLDMADEGLLKQVSVFGDACPYLQQNSLRKEQLIEEIRGRFEKHRDHIQESLNIAASDMPQPHPQVALDETMTMTSFWKKELQRELKCISMYFENRGNNTAAVTVTRYEMNEEFKFSHLIHVDSLLDESFEQLICIIKGFKAKFPDLSYGQ